MASKMRGIVLTGASFALTAAVVVHAWMQKKQFYPTVVYLTKSSPCMAVLYLQAFVFVLLIGKLMRKIFFGSLRPAETEHLIEKSWYAVTDTCLAFTMFRDDFHPVFVAAFTVLLFLKAFHWLLEDRVDYMERSPVITFIFKLRVLSLLSILLMFDFLFVLSSYQTIISKGASVQLVFGFEYAIMITVVLTVFMKYILHLIDLQSDNPWENKAVYMLYVELITGFFRVMLYLCFMAIMVKIHTFPLFSIRPMYMVMRSFKKAVSDIVLSRRAIRNMNTLYADATAEELEASDSTCIICREEMRAPAANPGDAQAQRQNNGAGSNKKLPCGHIFHASCLRSWFQRQQTCPTCRLDILQNQPRPTPPPPPRPAPPPPAPPAHQGPYPPMFPPMYMPPPPMYPQQGNGQAPASAPAGGAPSTSAPQPPTGVPPPPGLQLPPMPPGMPPMTPPMFMPHMPFMPPPPVPPNLGGLSDEQLRAMEGNQRRAVELRVECLRNISLLLDAAFSQVQHYVTAVQAEGDAGLTIHAMPDLTRQPTPPPATSQEAGGPSSGTPPASDPSSSAPEVPGPSGLAQKPPTSSSDTSEPTSPNDDDLPSDADELRRRRLAKLASAPRVNQEHEKDD